MVFVHIFFYISSFFLLWYCSGIIVNSVGRLASKLKLSSFAVSFFVLGILTSIPEFSVGINSIIDKTPDIFVGNLLGASLVLFILVIPLLAVFGGGVKLIHQLNENNLIFSLLVVAAPIFLIADNVLTRTEGVFLILIYVILFYFIEKKNGLMAIGQEKKISSNKKHFIEDSIEIILAAVIIFLASKFIVNETIYFASFLHVSEFIIGLLVLSIGTNLPELSLAIKSIFLGKKEVALGDYLGSAAANTLLFGLFTLLNGKRINVSVYSFRILILTLLGLGVFYLFSRSKNDISKREGKILLLIYLLFIISQVLFP
ncbi:MAG: Na+/Ca+ antiporter, CaCA family [Candidatus Roizmanbacteria bacterium GW2011_GWA2_32_13]|uniref:Na+/Ca+ antiporter, CaCA family n=1 Tax=Candidatus Roizmanbacteria bacterium GW2011_GWA2_32_13 TaxID=1618475 RepID=A0A0F9YZN4_9BACT|nr:MAG: Na+/Ca+ antiporter, CaCA family [Candidatus Roizmanbacteria bacterium GW2011_GWA2_32_13]